MNRRRQNIELVHFFYFSLLFSHIAKIIAPHSSNRRNKDRSGGRNERSGKGGNTVGMPFGVFLLGPSLVLV